MSIRASFGRWLSARRHLLDLTQEELAQRVGCSVITIRKLEADERRPSKQMAERLAINLDIAQTERSAFLTLARTETRAVLVDTPLFVPASPAQTTLLTSLTPLIGRESDLAAIRNQLLHDNLRLLTLIGTAGIGKTRLALVIGHEVQALFAQGVVLVPLAAISDDDLVVSTIAQALGVKESSAQPLLVSLQRHLADQAILLILDNFEQVLTAAPSIAMLLAACPRLKILATSRAPLHIRGEQLYPVSPLLLPDLLQLPSLQILKQVPAVALFIERAQAMEPAFRLTNQNATAVVQICARLDGLPLAIELVAARIRLLPPSALLARLDDWQALLIDGPRDLPPRQQTLRSAIAWSYDLLNASQQQLFQRLSVFVDGFTLAAAEALYGDQEAIKSGDIQHEQDRSPGSSVSLSLLDRLAGLLDQSLLLRKIGANDEPRFTMLETIRQYALEKLLASGEFGELRRRHAAYYLAFANQLEPGLQSAQQRASLQQLDTEYDNLRAALTWNLESKDEIGWGVELASALGNYWNIRGSMSEGRRWLEAVLAVEYQTCDVGFYTYQRTKARARALNWAAVLAWQQNDYVRTRALAEQSLTLFRELGDKRGIASALFSLGIVAFRYAEHGQAMALLEEDLALSREIGDKRLICSALSVLGNVARAQGDLIRAASMHQQCLMLAIELKEPQNLIARLNAFAQTLHYQGDDSQAAALLEQSFSLANEQGEKPGMALALYGLGLVAQAHDDLAQAEARFLESLRLRWEIGDRNGIAQCLEGLGAIAVTQGHPEQGIRLCASAEGLRQMIGAQLNKVERPVYERIVAAAHAQLDEAAFITAWAAGQAMPLDQWIMEVLAT